MTLWGGRFTGKLDPKAWAFNSSLSFDRRLALQDVRASIAWAQALGQAGVLAEAESEQICAGLNTISGEFAQQQFVYQESDEDIHSAVERRLGELIGDLAGKLHTGRSRNDQVATDLRMWLLEAILNLETALQDFQTVLVERAEADMEVLMPGYTHLQRAQPILLGHWWLSHFWPCQRDRQRLAQLHVRTASLPLGAGALAGSAFPVDRPALASALGFLQASPNSLDAVSDRDFVAEFLFITSLIGVHLSKLAEQVVLFSSAEFGFFELPEAFSTGSSLMPQKKNPDVFELVRGKAGALLGNLTGFMATLKGLPSSYDKDLQEDKEPVFEAYDTLMKALPVLGSALQVMGVHPEKMRLAIDAGMLATDFADYLVGQGVPFRKAHGIAGQAVQMAGKLGKPLDGLSLQEFQSLHKTIKSDVYGCFDPKQSVARRNVLGGTAPGAVRAQLEQAKSSLQNVTA